MRNLMFDVMTICPLILVVKHNIDGSWWLLCINLLNIQIKIFNYFFGF